MKLRRANTSAPMKVWESNELQVNPSVEVPLKVQSKDERSKQVELGSADED